MPFTSAGVKPDLIINPHAIPSRMTIAQLKETVLGKVLLELGLFGDGTSFGNFEVKDICSELINCGYEAHGNELMYNGLTGEQIECSVFMGPAFYQRLKHMVNDKAHSRAIGPMVNLTRQPAEGRSRDGGLRFGEMERDCFWYRAPITLNNGLSVEIGEMDDCDDTVLGWDTKTKMMIPSRQTDFMMKGERECVDVTFQDGRKITCTEDHPLLLSSGEWMKATDVLDSAIKTSVTCPLVNMKNEIMECCNWKLSFGTQDLFTHNKYEYLKSMAFARIIGYLIMDGTISCKATNKYTGAINLGHMIDVQRILEDLSLFCPIEQANFLTRNYYSVRIPGVLLNDIVQLKGLTIGRKVNQPSILPEFILDENCPKPIIREFLAAMFGADGHACVLGLHRGKRDLLTSISFSKTRTFEHVESLTQMMESIRTLLSKFGIVNTTIQKLKETTSSKNKTETEGEKSYQSTLHLNIDELIPFAEKIGFRYCCHKSQRLEAGVTYKRLRNEVVRQHNWLTNRVDELTNFKQIKTDNPNATIQTKKAIEKAVEDLKLIEPLIHEYAIPSTHDITDHLIKGTSFGKFGSKAFPTAEEFLTTIGAIDWFNESQYGVNREQIGLPTMNLKVIDIRPAGIHKVYDISVDDTNSFLANGIVAHNCVASHGATRFMRGRMYDSSDKYSVHVCKKCGHIASYNDKMHIHHCRMCDNRADFSYVEIPYACKLLFQELNTMNVAPRIITDH